MSKSVAFVFPGQGSQFVGMGADVYQSSPAARRVFEIADRAVGFSLSTRCFEGPEETLRETINTQPALVTTSLALLAALQEAAGATLPDSPDAPPFLATPLRPSFVIGHSVGEYAALATAGALDVVETVRLVRERGRLMHQEGSACPSGMAAVLGLDEESLQAICATATEQARAELGDAPDGHPGLGRVIIANDNAPGQIVISGSSRALEIAMELARAQGARKVVPLSVSGAFHSPVMAPAARSMADAVDAVTFHDAQIPVISNITATPLTAASDLREELPRQIESSVQWRRGIEYLVNEGVTTFVEIGAGQVLAGLIKRIARGSTIYSVGSASESSTVAVRLREQMEV